MPWQPVTTISIISNKEIEDTMKTVKLFEVPGLTKKGAGELIEHKAKEKKWTSPHVIKYIKH